MMSRASFGFGLSAGLQSVLVSSAFAAAQIVIVSGDGPNEGFNDTTPVAPVAGNAGTTLGEQRTNAFRAAADVWEAILTSPVEITVDAVMDPLTPCSATAGVLGRAGTNAVFRDFANAPLANTWYPSALATASPAPISMPIPTTSARPSTATSTTTRAACPG